MLTCVNPSWPRKEPQSKSGEHPKRRLYCNLALGLSWVCRTLRLTELSSTRTLNRLTCGESPPPTSGSLKNYTPRFTTSSPLCLQSEEKVLINVGHPSLVRTRCPAA